MCIRNCRTSKSERMGRKLLENLKLFNPYFKTYRISICINNKSYFFLILLFKMNFAYNLEQGKY